MTMTSSLPSFNAPQGDQLLQLFQAGQYHQVVAEAERIGVSPESDPIASNTLAASLFQLGQYSRAATVLEALEAPLGHERDYLSLYGATCRRLGLLQRAEDLLRRALQIDPHCPQVRNNYANLLIDLGRADEARNILEQLLAEQPNYQDARINLNRIQFRAHQNPPALSPTALSDKAWSPADPLMLAFAEEEVLQAGGVKPAQPQPDATTLVSRLPKPEAKDMAADQLRLATQAVAEGNSDFALQLCSQALSGLGANASIYVNASDAYIKLQRFREAEICLLHALVIGGSNITHYINLISLASIRGDFLLAEHYLDQAAGLDPTHPQLFAVRKNLQGRKSSESSRFYRFAPHWPEPQLKPLT